MARKRKWKPGKKLKKAVQNAANKVDDRAEKIAAEAERKARLARERIEREKREAKAIAEAAKRKAREEAQRKKEAAEAAARKAAARAARIEEQARKAAEERRRKFEARKAAAARKLEQERKRAEQIKDRVGTTTRKGFDDVREDLRDAKDKVVDRAEDKVRDAKDKVTDNVKSVGRRLIVKTWPTGAPGFHFPESREPDLLARDDIGLAVSGGGTRSMALGLGYMRFLHEKGLLDRIRYIGAISGGSWLTVPYAWLPSRISDEDFFGEHVATENLTLSRAKTLQGSDGMMFAAIVNSQMWLSAVIHLLSAKLWKVFRLPRIPVLGIQLGLTDTSETWSRTIGEVFLKPFGLDGDRYAEYTEKQRNGIIRRNRNLLGRKRLEGNDFHIQTRSRPYLCINGAMNQDAYLIPDDPDEKVRPLGWKSWEHWEFTPAYSGIHRHSRGKAKLNVGGGYKENIGMDTVLPVATSDGVKVSPGLRSHRFSLSDMMGISGAAPAFAFQRVQRMRNAFNMTVGNPLRIREGALTNIFPRLRDWPVNFHGKPVVVERFFGDGGYVDNYGLIPLLKRRVSKIVVLINTDIPIAKPADRIRTGEDIDSFLFTLFGRNSETFSTFDPTIHLQPGRWWGRDNGQVFPTADLDATINGLCKNWDDTRKRHIGPVFHRGTYTTLQNDFFGVPAGHTCEILWVYNAMTESWRNRLPADIAACLPGGGGNIPEGLESFPHISTLLPESDPRMNRKDLLEDIAEHGIREAMRRRSRGPAVDLDSLQMALASNLAFSTLEELEDEIDALLS